jgi:predicted acyltransferase
MHWKSGNTDKTPLSQDTTFAPFSSTARVASLDILRGLTILVMIFVNDVAGVSGTPAWMKHVQPPDADGMTCVDVVFPAFLFLVGTTIPFAIGRRLERSESLARVWLHVLARTLGLLVIGVFMVNEETISADRGTLTPAQWTLLMYLGVSLVWCTMHRLAGNVAVQLVMRAVGVALLVAAALLYRGRGEPSLIELRPQWWGILGLIGWAYLVASIVYILFRTQLAAIVGAVALLHCVYIADAVGAFDSLTWVTRFVGIGGMLGSHAAITVSGVALGMILMPDSAMRSHGSRLRWGLLYGCGLAAAGWLLHSAHDLHRMFIINKIHATPPWCLWCSAITTWAWVLVYWLTDVRLWRRWAGVLQRAGQNPLVAYMLAPVLYAVFTIVADISALPITYEELGRTFAIGFWRSVGFALLLVWLAGRLLRTGIQLKL